MPAQMLASGDDPLQEILELPDQPQALALRMDAEGRILDVDGAWAGRLAVANPAGKSIYLEDLITRSGRRWILPIFERLQAGEIVAGAFVALKTESGEPRLVHGIFRPTMENGNLAEVSAVFADRLAGRYGLEAEDQSMDQQLLQALVEFAPDGMMITDIEQDIIAFNSRFLELWGLDSTTVWSGKARATAASVVENRDEFLADLAALYADPHKTGSGALQLEDGRVLDWYSAGTWDTGGAYIGRAWYYRDGTERVRLQDEIKRSETLYRQLAANFPGGAVFIYDSDLSILLADGAGLADVGLTRGAIAGKAIKDVLPGRIADRLKPMLLDALSGKPGQQDIRFVDRTFSTAAVPLDFAGSIAGRHGMIIAQDVSGRKELEDRLRGAETRLRALVEQIPAVTYVQHVRETGNATIFISPQIEKIYGYTVAELTDGSVEWLETIHPEDRAMVLAATDAANRRGTPFAMEYRSLTRDGDVRWVRDEATVIGDATSRDRFWQGILTDVTDERRLQQSLSESEALFRSAFDDAAIGIMLVGLDGRMRRANKAFADMLGYTEEEIVAKGRVRNFTHPDDVERDVAAFLRFLKREVESYRLDKRFIHADGRTVWAQVDVSFVYDALDEPSYVVAQVQDITEQRRLEEELRRSEVIFRNAFDYAAIGMARVALDGRWLDVNRSLCAMLGYERNELLETDFQHITHPDDLDKDLAYVQQVVDGAISTYAIEKRYFHKGGGVVWAELSVSLVRDASGEPLFFISQIQDVTGKKELERRLQQLALHDNLTGALNRHGLAQALDQSEAPADEPIAVMMLDMNRFKVINDTFGHDAGDRVLQETASRIREVLRGRDLLARLGGDEFVIVLSAPVDARGVRTIARRLRQAIEAPIVLEGTDARPVVGASIGFSLGLRSDRLSDLLRAADEAMYRDKHGDRAKNATGMAR